MKFPAYLKPGDTIAIVCPAGYLPAAKAKACINTLKKWGYKVAKGKTLGGKSKNYFCYSFCV
jgi:muramoyltetrapeptide carboxypeptidase